MKLKIHSQLIIIALIFNAYVSKAQISLFKDINVDDDSSFPENFIEFRGNTYFTAYDGVKYTLWKTDASSKQTVKASNYSIGLSEYPTLQIVNNNLYYFTSDRLLIENDGSQETILVTNCPRGGALQRLNTSLFLNNNYGLYNLSGIQDFSDAVKLGENLYFKFSPFIKDNFIYFFTVKSYKQLYLMRTDGTQQGTSEVYFFPQAFLFSNGSSRKPAHFIGNHTIGNQTFFLITSEDKINRTFSTELWKLEGTTPEFVKKINQGGGTIRYSVYFNMFNYNGKLVFGIYEDNWSTGTFVHLWISDGTENGTVQFARLISPEDVHNHKWAVLNNKLYFSAKNDQSEGIWESDGSIQNTREIFQSETGLPNHLISHNGLIYFITAGNVILSTDGTNEGTEVVERTFQNPDLKELHHSGFFIDSQNNLFISSYVRSYGFEPWIKNLNSNSFGLLININNRNKKSWVSPAQVNFRDKIYFTAQDSLGVEVWQTNGTREDTKILNDFTPGPGGSDLFPRAATRDHLYFTRYLYSQSTNTQSAEFYRTDSLGKVFEKIPIPYDPYYLGSVASTDEIFFASVYSTNQVYDGTWAISKQTVDSIGVYLTNMRPINNRIVGVRQNYTIVSSDGTYGGTHDIFERSDPIFPERPVCLIKFKGYVYFFASYWEGDNYRSALYRTDGTRSGSEIVKPFPYDDGLVNTENLFLESSDSLLYFRVRQSLNVSIDLWTSDGTEAGTKKIFELPYSYSMRYFSAGNNFFILQENFITDSQKLWVTKGTPASTLILKELAYIPQPDPYSKNWVSDNGKLYLPMIEDQNNYHLWFSDGTVKGTYRLFEDLGEEFIKYNAYNYSGMFTIGGHIYFWAEHPLFGKELYRFETIKCEENKAQTVQSGDWDDPEIWSCGQVPSVNDHVQINNGNRVHIPNGREITIKGIETVPGSVLQVENGSVFNVRH